MYLTIDNAKEIKAEERAYLDWQNQEKSRILKMTNLQKRQSAWSHLFPQVEHSEGWELSVSIF